MTAYKKYLKITFFQTIATIISRYWFFLKYLGFSYLMVTEMALISNVGNKINN